MEEPIYQTNNVNFAIKGKAKPTKLITNVLININESFRSHTKYRPLIFLLSIALACSSFFTNTTKYQTAPRLLVSSSGLCLIVLLLILSFLDISEMYIPSKLCHQGLVLGLIITGIIGCSFSIEKGLSLMLEHLIAAKLFQVIMKTLSILSEKFFKQQALGLGDANLAAMGGGWLGIHGISLAIGIAFISAGLFSFVGILCGKLKRLQPFPFAPFISAGIWGVWLFEPSWWSQQWLYLLGL